MGVVEHCKVLKHGELLQAYADPMYIEKPGALQAFRLEYGAQGHVDGIGSR